MINIPISLEFFPPKTPEGMTKLAAARAELYALKPEFCSVTYGAGGSTQMGTLQVVQAIRDEGCHGRAALHLHRRHARERGRDAGRLQGGRRSRAWSRCAATCPAAPAASASSATPPS